MECNEKMITQVILYSKENLQDKIIPQSEIVYKYSLENPNRIKPYHEYGQDEEIPKERLVSGSEIFKEHPDDKIFAISNYGRIKVYKNSDAAWEILEQGSKSDTDLTLRIIGKTVFGLQDTHRLVADTWLEEPAKLGAEVHHINNDGYDNRPENLIWIESKMHGEINHRWRE